MYIVKCYFNSKYEGCTHINYAEFKTYKYLLKFLIKNKGVLVKYEIYKRVNYE